MEPKDFSNIYSELSQALVSIWQTLPSETQDAKWKKLSRETQRIIMHELSKQTARFWRNLPASNIPKTMEEREFLDINDMNQNQILHAVAQKRIQQYATLQKAAASLGIDTRTLQKYAEWQE
ncbi:hypothetical protein C6503_00200 [Candidatus Poribacteria bacterium]|nr:MAG: hypothetical protein C6503_00200 [Candidatus Poribacteria bacterium]